MGPVKKLVQSVAWPFSVFSTFDARVFCVTVKPAVRSAGRGAAESLTVPGGGDALPVNVMSSFAGVPSVSTAVTENWVVLSGSMPLVISTSPADDAYWVAANELVVMSQAVTGCMLYVLAGVLHVFWKVVEIVNSVVEALSTTSVGGTTSRSMTRPSLRRSSG